MLKTEPRSASPLVKTIVITVLATDRPGIVHTLSETLLAHQGNWIDSRMANLADKFAGLVKISVPQGNITGLREALQQLHDADNQLQILLEDAQEADTVGEKTNLEIELLGADRPGIIDDITGTLAKLSVNINELVSEQREASMSSEILFYAKLKLTLPDNVSPEDVQDVLEAMSDQLMVDISFND